MKPIARSALLATALLAGSAVWAAAQGPVYQPGAQPGAQPGFQRGMQRGFQASLQAARLDPGPNPMGLLTRVEVQNEIVLDMKQRNALNALLGAEIAQRQQQMQAFAELRNLPPQMRRQRMQELRAQMQAQPQPTRWQGELTEQVKSILRPEQVKRLHELDLQKRGLPALSDAKVAEEVKLTPDHRQQITQAVNQADADRQQLVATALQEWRQNGGNPQSMPDTQSRLSPLRQQMDAIAKAATKKVNALLSAEERTRWEAAQGKAFVFREDTASAGAARRF